MPRSTRFASVFASALLALSLAIGSTPPANAEDATRPAPPAAAATTAAPKDATAAPVGAERAVPSPPGADKATTVWGRPDARTDSRERGPRLTRTIHGFGSSESVQNGQVGAASSADPESDGSVYGWVWESYSDDMVEGIEVKIWQKDNINNSPDATTVTDSDGYYSLGVLPPGEYLLWFGGDGFISQWWDNDIWGWMSATVLTVTADGKPIEANAELDHWDTITGTVTNAKGKPVANGWVRLYIWLTDENYWAEWDSNPTDSDGRFTFPQLRPGTYAAEGHGLPKGSRLKVEGRYVSLLSFSGSKTGGVLAPWVLGTPSIGMAQKADVGPGSWKKTSFSYQWLRDGVSIPKATKQTYTPGAADLDRQLQVRVTSRQGNNSFTVTSPTSWAILESSVPKIKGSLAVDNQVSVDPGSWQAGMVLRYQWYADGKAISGATDPSLVPTKAQKGKRLTAKVTGKYRDFPQISRTSTRSAKVAIAGTPTVSGAAAVGSTLKAKPGTWTKKTKLSYQWLRNGTAIAKATKSSYKLTVADAGALISVRVTGKLSGYATVSVVSAAHGPV